VWQAAPWNACTTACGTDATTGKGGVQTRTVQCHKIQPAFATANGMETTEVLPSGEECVKVNARPASSKACNAFACGEEKAALALRIDMDYATVR
jgi:hypothetical protein